MAKLKKFNNQTDYRTFIASSEFSAPDISTIGTSTVLSDLDVEYNPFNMLYVNAKQNLAPTATTIPFIIDTITNGKVAIWWRPSTGTTYTKVNSTDLIFNSGYTKNKITNLVINTKPVSTDYNNIYIVSAVSDTSISINDIDNTTQYGLITLDGTTFDATGGSKTIQVKTAPGNKWQITNVPSWLTFSQTTGSGPTSITVTASEYTSITTDRTGTVTIGYIDLEYTTTSGNFIQNKKVEDDYFAFREHSKSFPSIANTTNVTYDASGSTIGKTIYFVSSDSSWLTVTPASTTAVATGSINISTIANPNRTTRSGTITARMESAAGDIIDTINVTQQGANVYFYVGSSVANALSTSAITYAYPSTVGSADTTSKKVYFATNYSASEVQGLSVNYPESISNVSVNTSDSSITFNFNTRPIVTGATATTRNATITVGAATITSTQAAPAYFKWNNSRVTVGSAAGSTGSNTYSSNISYYSITVSKSSTGAFISSGPTINSTGVTFTVSGNETTEDKTCTITAILGTGSTTLDTFTVTQNGADAYFWTGSMNVTAATTTIDSTGQTGCEVQCYSNTTSSYLNGITVSGNSSSWITNISWSSLTKKVTFNIGSYSGIDARSGVIGIYDSNRTMIGSITINQGAAAPYFKFVPNNSTAYTYNTNTSAATTFSVAIDTNYKLSDIKTQQGGSGINVHTYTSTTEVSVTTSNNTEKQSKTGYIYFYTGSTYTSGRIGLLTVTQNAAPYAQITGGGNYSTGETADTLYFVTNYASTDNLSLIASASTNDWLTIDYTPPLVNGTNYTYRIRANSGNDNRTGYIVLYDGSTKIDFITINQEGQGLPTYSLYFTNYSSVTTRTVTVDSAVTSYSEAITYTYPSLSTGKTSNISLVTYDSNSMTANFDANTSRNQRTVGTATVTGTGGAGAIITLTLEIKQNGVAPYLTWSDGTTSTSVNVSNTGANRTHNISTNWTSTELSNLTVSSNVAWLTGKTVSTSSASYSIGANAVGGSSRTGTITWKNGSTTVLTLTVNQEAGESYSLYFTNYSSVTTRTVTVDSAVTSYSEAITYTYPSLSTGKTSYISSVTYNSNSITANFGANTSRNQRTVGTATVTGTGGTGASITLTLEIKQNGVAPYLTWSDGTTSASVNVSNTSANRTHDINTNWTSTELSNLTVSSNVTWLTGKTVSTSSASYSVGANAAGSSSRTGIITWKSGSTTVLTLTVNQEGKDAFSANLSVSSTSIGSGTTGFTISTAPNDSSQSYSIYVDSTSVTSTTGNYSGTYNCGENTSTSSRTMRVAVKVGTSTVEYIDVTQDAKAYYTIQSTKYIDGNSHTNVTLTADTNMVGTFYVTADAQSWHSTPTISSDGKTITLSSINSYTSDTTSTRAINCLVRYNTTTGAPLAVGVIVQSSTIVLVPNLKVNNSTNPSNIGSAVTSFTISTTPNTAYTGSYTIYINGTPFTSTTGNYSGSYTCGENTDVSASRTFTVTCGNESVSITQNRKKFYSNLRINSSTSPSNIGSATTTFSISTTPNDTAATYDIVVNGTKITTRSGNYSGYYTCGANPDTNARTFTAVTTCNDFVSDTESVTIKQNSKYVAQTRIVQVAGGGAQWDVNMVNQSVIQGQHIVFQIGTSEGKELIHGDVFGDTEGIYTTEMHGDIQFETSEMGSFTLSLNLSVDSDGPLCRIHPIQGNVYGFSSGEIGSGGSGYDTIGTVVVPSGSPNTTTSIHINNMTWEVTDY